MSTVINFSEMHFYVWETDEKGGEKKLNIQKDKSAKIIFQPFHPYNHINNKELYLWSPFKILKVKFKL